MSDDKFEEVVTTSWLDRIKNAVFGMIFGLVFFIGSFYLLSWNEGRSVAQYKNLQEGEKSVIDIPSNRVDQNYNNKLVHLTGLATTQETLIDPIFNVSQKAIKLKRVVKMYQWKESSESHSNSSTGGSSTTTTTYTYSKVWEEQPINSSGFKKPEGHDNPTSWEYMSSNWQANKVDLDAFILSNTQIDQIDNFARVNVDASTLPDALKNTVKVQNGAYYIGEDLQSPKIGDLQIEFYDIAPLQVSIIAQQINNSFQPYHTHTGKLDLLETGTHSAEDMFTTEEQLNELLTWGLRLGGFVLMFLGLSLLFGPIVILADFIPFLGTLTEAGSGIFAVIIAFSLSLITITIAWLSYHPLLGWPLLALGICFPFILKFLPKKIK